MADRQVDALEVQHRIAEELRQILLFPCPGNTGCQRTLNMEGRDVQILVWCRDHIIRWVVCFMCTLCVVGMTSFALLIWLVISLVPSCCSQYFANIALFENICRDAKSRACNLGCESRLGPCKVGGEVILASNFRYTAVAIDIFSCLYASSSPASTYQQHVILMCDRNEQLTCDRPLLEWVTVVHLGYLLNAFLI